HTRSYGDWSSDVCSSDLLRELLAVPESYQVLFVQGGATGQFAAVPLNLARADSAVDYLNTGHWSKKAIGEARRLAGKVSIVADRSEERRVGKECRSRGAT